MPPVAFIGARGHEPGRAQRACAKPSSSDEKDFIVPEHYCLDGRAGRRHLREPKKCASAPSSAFTSCGSTPDQAELCLQRSAVDGERRAAARSRRRTWHLPAAGKIEAYLGIDIGSVSTNLVVIDSARQSAEGDLSAHPGPAHRSRGRRPGGDRADARRPARHSRRGHHRVRAAN